MRYVVMLCLLFSASHGQEKVLFLMTAANTQELQNGKARQTGYFLNEFYEAYKAIRQAGYDIDFASPEGAKPTIDEESLKDKYWKDNLPLKRESLDFVASEPEIKEPMALEEALARNMEYVAMVVPGGQGVMVDLFHDKSVPELLLKFASHKRPIGLICHAPALLLKMPLADNPMKGFKVNSVSGFEEWIIETFVMDGKAKDRKIGSRLEKAGFDYESGFPGRPHAVRDQFLVTSQNPFSGQEFNRAFLAALEEFRAGKSLQAFEPD